jgi:hypothetical protein
MTFLRPHKVTTRRFVITGLAALLGVFALAACASLEPKKTPLKFFVQIDQPGRARQSLSHCAAHLRVETIQSIQSDGVFRPA